MSFHPHMTAPGSGFGHMKFMKDMKGMMNMMEQLKKHNKDGETALMSAANNGHGDAIRLVLEAMRQTGVEQEGTLTTANKMGSTALLLADRAQSHMGIASGHQSGSGGRAYQVKRKQRSGAAQGSALTNMAVNNL